MPVLRPVPLDGPEGRTLIGELQQEYVRRYGGPDETPVDPRQFDPPDGAFLVLVDGPQNGSEDGPEDGDADGGELLGCAGLRRHDASTCELKRMYVRSTYRRRGLARLLLAAAEDRARELGYHRLVLETGNEQPEALALYVSAGYQPLQNFGFYQDSGLDRSFEKVL